MIRLLAFAIFLTLTCSAPSVAQVSDKSVCEGATIPGPSWATDNPLSPWFHWLKEAAKARSYLRCPTRESIYEILEGGSCGGLGVS